MRRWPFTLYICERGHVDTTTLRNVCWQCFPGGRGGHPTQQAVEVVPLSEVKEALQKRFEDVRELAIRAGMDTHVEGYGPGEVAEKAIAVVEQAALAAFPSTDSEGQG